MDTAQIETLFQNENSSLEILGKALTPQEFIDILAHLESNNLPTSKLASLLVGLPSGVFAEALFSAPQKILAPLKGEGLMEPLEHHLTLFTHECMNRVQKCQEQTDALYEEINRLDIQRISSEIFDTFQTKFQIIIGAYYSILEAINKGLSIIWNAGRIDLIEKLMTLKETIHFELKMPLKGESRQTAGMLPLYLEERLGKVYASANDSFSVQLQDDDLASDGLAKLSVWYLKDYWELGLLPSIKNIEVIDKTHSEANEKANLHQQQELYNLVQSNLKRIGIHTVGDLKKARIYSKEALKKYIASHSHLLT